MSNFLKGLHYCVRTMAALKKQKKYNWKETNLAQFGSELEKQVRHVPVKRLNLAFYGYIYTCIFSALLKLHVNKLLLLLADVRHICMLCWISFHRSRRRVQRERMHGRELGRRKVSRSGGLSSLRYMQSAVCSQMHQLPPTFIPIQDVFILALSMCSLPVLPYGEKFLWDKIFAVFTDLPQTAKILTAKFYPQCKPHPFPSIGVAYFRSGYYSLV